MLTAVSLLVWTGQPTSGNRQEPLIPDVTWHARSVGWKHCLHTYIDTLLSPRLLKLVVSATPRPAPCRGAPGRPGKTGLRVVLEGRASSSMTPMVCRSSRPTRGRLAADLVRFTSSQTTPASSSGRSCSSRRSLAVDYGPAAVLNGKGLPQVHVQPTSEDLEFTPRKTALDLLPPGGSPTRRVGSCTFQGA